MTDMANLNLALYEMHADCVLLVKRPHDDPQWTATAISPVGAPHARHGRGHAATEALINMVRACKR